MSTPQTQTKHNQQTRHRFEELLYDALVTRENGSPEATSYDLQDPCTAGDSARITVHNDAWKNTPLNTGDSVKQLYFDKLGIVIIDLNPRED